MKVKPKQVKTAKPASPWQGYSPPRNWVVRNPLMRKGGPHQKTKKAERHQDKQALKKSLGSPRDFDVTARVIG